MDTSRGAFVVGETSGGLVCKGIRWSEPYDEISRLVSKYGIPFITSPMGCGCLPDERPLCYKDARGVLVANADVVLLAEARLDWSFHSAVNLPPLSN